MWLVSGGKFMREKNNPHTGMERSVLKGGKGERKTLVLSVAEERCACGRVIWCVGV